MPDVVTGLLTSASGAIVGLVLGLVGGGGSILAVPLLVYLVGLSPPHVALGTSALAVSATAFGNLLSHARRGGGTIKWRCAAVFSSAGVLGALLGADVAKRIDGQALLILFGLLMVGVGLVMLRRPGEAGNLEVQLTRLTARVLVPPLLAIGFAVGSFSGFFGIGGGFLIVPGLMLATGMPLRMASATSLISVSAFGAATASSYAATGLIDWTIAALFILGGIGGGVVGVALSHVLVPRKREMGIGFAALVVAVGLYVIARGIRALSGT